MWSSSSSDSDKEIAIVRRRVYKQRINVHFTSFFEYNERFRLSNIAVEQLLTEIGHRLHHPTYRSYALSAKFQLLVALHWFGNGGQYHGIGDMHGISKSSVCRALHSVVRAINVIKFPTVVNWPPNVVDVLQLFFEIAGMPQIAGCEDGTLINIDAPSQNEEQYVDRHGNHSISCMLVCGPDLKFYYASANWPGSVHDARVLRNSSLCRRMEQGWRPFPNSVLLGDSAYPLKDWLIPPKLTNLDELRVQRFNRAHKSTRRLIENAIGILKEKFPCLNHLRVNPVFAANIFKCCVTLCNISRENVHDQDDIRDINVIIDSDDVVIDDNEDNNPQPNALIRLQQLVNNFA